MEVRTACSSAPGLAEALEEVSLQLQGFAPTVLVVAFNTVFSGEQLVSGLEARFGCIIAGCSSCKGALCVVPDASSAYASHTNATLSLFAISDPQGHYGVGQHQLDPEDVQASAKSALDMALYASGRGYESPAVIWCMLPPGQEENIIAGFQSVVGETVPILGGSSADNDVSGKWQQVSTLTAGHDHIVVLVLYPSRPLGYAFSSGYKPGPQVMTVTGCDGRQLNTLDHTPAAAVYNRLTGHTIDGFLQGGNVLAASTLHPLGRKVGAGDHYHEYLLSHPHTVTAEGAMTLFSEVSLGDELVLMEGSRDSLIHRADRVLCNALDLLEEGARPKGVLMIYCAGCMLAIETDLTLMINELRRSHPHLPIMAMYTFGEQGCFLDGKSRHGNLMISALVFSA
ncbi:FIST signal transduction protein [Ketobacter sp.]|uniref:FIST signal transduction protein n=1 Tax=Ketobacter sp. TaxID=2083498 RepID=UPI0025BFE6A5|nr:FIST N-terminal domain-containing protein [Ketobacter sp.]